MIQGDLTITTYTDKFHNLAIRSETCEAQNILDVKYFVGLKQKIQDDITTACIQIVGEAYKCALLIEEKLQRRAAKRASIISKSSVTKLRRLLHH